jgi:glycosyltransferase involved in cell wall biosynthesis
MLEKIFLRLMEKINQIRELRITLNSNNIRKRIYFYRKAIDYLKKENDNKNTNLTELIFIKNPKFDNLKVSIVTPVFNGEKFIEDIAASIEKQTLAKNIEWIIVDDCSFDNTFDIILNFSKEINIGNLILLKNKRNLGASYSLKIGVENTNSDIVAWCSVDDFYISNNKLEIDYKIIKNKEADIVFSKSFLLGTDLKKSKRIELNDVVKSNNFWDNLEDINQITYDNIKLASFLFFHNLFNGSSVVFDKKKYYQVGGFDEFLLNIDADWDLFIRILISNFKIYFSDTIIFNRIHSSQTSKNFINMAFGISLSRIRMLRAIQETNYLNSLLTNFSLILNSCKKKMLFPFGKSFPFGFNWLLNFRYIIFFYFFIFQEFKDFFKVYDFNIKKYIDEEVWKELTSLIDLLMESSSFKIFRNNLH